MNIEIYTDGNCYKEFLIGGWGVYIIIKNKKIKFSGVCECKNSIELELTAILKALEYIEQYIENLRTIDIDFYTDCDYAFKIIKEFKDRGKFSFRNKTSLQNKKTISEILAYTLELPIKWHIIKSHKGNVGNKIADTLAKKAALLRIKERRQR